MMDGGVPPMAMPARGGLPTAAAPMKPSLAMRRKAMRAMPSAAAPAGPVGMAGRMMKKGGSCEEMIQEHANKPASKAHKGLKTGGVAMGQSGFKEGGIINTEGQGGEYRTTKINTAERTTKTSGKTGEVKNGNGGGFKKGGRCYAKGGGVEGNVSTTPAGKTNTTTGGVKLGNAGGFKKGGATKKAADGGKKGKPAVKDRAQKYADGGMVQGAPMGLPSVSPMGRVGLPPVSASGRIYDPYNSMLAQQPGGQPTPVGYATGGSVQDDGRAVKMPKPRVPTPVSINQLSGTYKKGGRVK
jgi:hypothetical protein